MAQGQLDELADLGHLFTATTDVIIPDFVQIALLVLAFDRRTFKMDHGLRSYDGRRRWLAIDNLEFHSTHAAANQKIIMQTDGAICVQEIWLQKYIKDVSSDTFQCIVDRKDMDARGIFDVRMNLHTDDVAQFDADVLPCH